MNEEIIGAAERGCEELDPMEYANGMDAVPTNEPEEDCDCGLADCAICNPVSDEP